MADKQVKFNGQKPPDRIFVLGDNRDNSLDSPHWEFVPGNYLGGAVMLLAGGDG